MRGHIMTHKISAPTSAYFAHDGNYGSASAVVIVDVSKWTDDDWTEIDEALDDERVELATKIASRY